MELRQRQILLSAVTREFQRSREMLKSYLTGPDLPWNVAEQADFAVSGTTLLEKLSRYIAESSSVVHLIGTAPGARPMPLEVENFLAGTPDFLKDFPGLRSLLADCLQISYTQWEAYLALHHRAKLFLYIPTPGFSERPPAFITEPAEMENQKTHSDYLFTLGMDRTEFATSEHLCSLVLRSFSRLLMTSKEAADREAAKDLEISAQFNDEGSSDPADARATLSPLQIDLLLPPYLVVGQTIAARFRLSEPGRTFLEQIDVHFSIGTQALSAHWDHLARGETAILTPENDLMFARPGTSRMLLQLSCTRSCLPEIFTWKEVANVISNDALEHGHGSSHQLQKVSRIRLELREEHLSQRIGLLDIALQPVPAGGCRFEMGSPRNERGADVNETLHPVRFAHSWWMSRHPISQQSFQGVTGENPSRFSGQSAEMPVESVTWQEAVKFCERLTQLEQQQDILPLGFHYRLPTEAEWEFSCRAGEIAPVPQIATASPSDPRAIGNPISTFPLDGNRGANRYGLCDMTGNVFQWCLDRYAPYPDSLQVDPCLVGEAAEERIIRGGSWHDPAKFRRPAARMKCDPAKRSSRIGFRIVLARI